MESITSVKIFHGSEFKANGKVIRWTEVGRRRTLVLIQSELSRSIEYVLIGDYVVKLN